MLYCFSIVLKKRVKKIFGEEVTLMAKEMGGWRECGSCSFSPSVCRGKCLKETAVYKPGQELSRSIDMTEEDICKKLDNEEAHYDYA